jgi:hypothetical protein
VPRRVRRTARTGKRKKGDALSRVLRIVNELRVERLGLPPLDELPKVSASTDDPIRKALGIRPQYRVTVQSISDRVKFEHELPAQLRRFLSDFERGRYKQLRIPTRPAHSPAPHALITFIRADTFEVECPHCGEDATGEGGNGLLSYSALKGLKRNPQCGACGKLFYVPSKRNW